MKFAISHPGKAACFPKPVCLDKALIPKTDSLHMFGTFLFARYKMKAVGVMHSQGIANSPI